MANNQYHLINKILVLVISNANKKCISLVSLPCLGFPENVSRFCSNDFLASATDGDLEGRVEALSRVAELVNLDGSS